LIKLETFLVLVGKGGNATGKKAKKNRQGGSGEGPPLWRGARV